MCNAARWSKLFLVASSILLIFPSLTRSTALAQEGFSSTTQDGALSDAPQPAQDTAQSGATDSRLAGTGSLSGTVLDTNEDVLQSARVTLAGRAGAAIQTVESGSNGQFAFTGLPPDVYKLTVTSAGMNTFTSTQVCSNINAFPEYGGGIEGYGKRYGAAGQSCLPFDLSSRPALLLQGEGRYPVARAVRDVCGRDCKRR